MEELQNHINIIKDHYILFSIFYVLMMKFTFKIIQWNSYNDVIGRSSTLSNVELGDQMFSIYRENSENKSMLIIAVVIWPISICFLIISELYILVAEFFKMIFKINVD